MDIERFTFNPLGNQATKLVYWDEEAYASEFIVSPGSQKSDATDNQAQGDVATGADGDGLAKAKKRKAEASSAAKPKKVRTSRSPDSLS